MMGDFGFGGMGFGWIIWLALIIGGFILIRGRGFGCGIHNTNSVDKSALEILKQRYAKGEINKEEFDRMKNDLS